MMPMQVIVRCHTSEKEQRVYMEYQFIWHIQGTWKSYCVIVGLNVYIMGHPEMWKIKITGQPHL